MDMNTDRIAPLLDNPRFHFFEGDITINQEWIEYHVRSATWCCRWWRSPRRRPTCSEPLRVFELDFEANLPIVRQCVKYGKRVLFPSTSEVYGMCRDGEFDPGRLRAGARPDRQAALDLLLLQAAAWTA